MRARGPDDSGRVLTGGTVSFSALTAGGTTIRLEPGASELATLRDRLGLLDLRKVRFTGRLVPDGQRDWRLEADLGATVIQPCTVTLKPVTTRLEEPVTRRYVANWSEPEAGTELEMPEDDSAEPLPPVLDLDAVLEEALSLALPLYPRAPEADFEGLAVTEPGSKPMTDDDAKPFAGLAGLRDQLTENGDEDET